LSEEKRVEKRRFLPLIEVSGISTAFPFPFTSSTTTTLSFLEAADSGLVSKGGGTFESMFASFCIEGFWRFEADVDPEEAGREG